MREYKAGLIPLLLNYAVKIYRQELDINYYFNYSESSFLIEAEYYKEKILNLFGLNSVLVLINVIIIDDVLALRC